jgi:hypothetical protein
MKGLEMSSQPISNMTRDELNQLIEEMIDRRLQAMWKPRSNRTTEEILGVLEQHRFTPPKGAKSTLELLREDRDA